MNCPHCQAPNPPEARFCADCGKPLTPPQANAATPSPKPPQQVDLSGLQTIEPGENKPAPPSHMMLQPGEMFAGRYQIESLVGQGGMGVVYRAKDTLTDTVVALKLIRADRLAGKDAVKRLIREGVLARDIRHPNVVAVYDVGENAGQPYISMQLVEGKSLRAWNQQRMQARTDCAMPVAADIIREILKGLDAAHAAGVIHRDLKPENILLLGEPEAGQVRLKILDFGIARAGNQADTSSTAMGSMGYMAPEQLTAPEAVQPSADIYSLSVIFYELLVGVVPMGHWQPPSGGRSDVPPGIDKLVEQGMSNNPRARPQSCAEYRGALDNALAAPAPKPGPVPKPAPPPPPPPKPKPEPVVIDNNGPGPSPIPPQPKPKRKIQLWQVGAGIVGVIAVIGGIGQMVQGGKELSGDDNKGSSSSNYTPPTPIPVPRPDPIPVPSPPPPPVPQPMGINYAGFSGYWTDDFQNTFTVNVSPSGFVQGQAMRGPMAGVLLTGQFAGPSLVFQVANAYQVLGGTTASFDGGCHLKYATTDAYGQVTGQAQWHINHQPGAPCP